MSRIGKRPIPLPPKVAVSIVGQEVTVKGPKGELKRVLPNTVEILQEESNLIVNRANESRPAKQQHGLFRTLVANMVEGGRTPLLSFEDLQAIGYGLAIFPATAFLAAAKSFEHVYTTLKETRSSSSVKTALYDFSAFSKLMGFDWVTVFDKAHAKPDSPTS